MMERWEGENPSATRQEIVEELRKVRIAADAAIKAERLRVPFDRA
jgi:hypothetical protein